jgi:hypothetical protein
MERVPFLLEDLEEEVYMEVPLVLLAKGQKSL